LKAAKLTPFTVLAALRARADDPRALVVDGAPALVPLLVRDLRRDGTPDAVRERGPLDRAAALVWVGAPDEGRLREAALARVPVVAVTDLDEVPYVLATDVVRVEGGRGFPIDAIAAALARRLGDRAPALAARLPVLRKAVVDALIAAAARRNGLLAAGPGSPGADMPVLTLEQVRLTAAIARAYGVEASRERVLEAVGVVGAGYGLRAVARRALGRTPAPDWAVRGAVAAGGTIAVGEAARTAFEAAVRRGSYA